ncbi:hypothetical protein [Ferrimonas kyonanensis]|uniref:hypothetical protein n=1 Tax=Ferrimonas kyonanensis TaxID=364763 RepID=UPI000487466D|nr:hypothetical protein [Ferrimonas kyonanensis]
MVTIIFLATVLHAQPEPCTGLLDVEQRRACIKARSASKAFELLSSEDSVMEGQERLKDRSLVLKTQQQAVKTTTSTPVAPKLDSAREK